MSFPTWRESVAFGEAPQALDPDVGQLTHLAEDLDELAADADFLLQNVPGGHLAVHARPVVAVVKFFVSLSMTSVPPGLIEIY